MDTVFEHAGETLENGIFVKAQFREGLYGTFEIYGYDTLELQEQQGERVYFEVSGGPYIAGLQEPEDMSERSRNREPYDRMSSETYIGHGFGYLDIITTSNGSRFLVLKEAWKKGGVFSSVDDYKGRCLALVLTEEELPECLADTVLPALGVPAEDRERIRDEIISRFTGI